MAQFLGDLAFLAELVLVAGGLVLLHRARLQPPAGLLRLAGYILVIGGIGGALCTGYYWFKYQAQGDFDHAYPVMMQKMSKGMMNSGMHEVMKDSDMQDRMQKMPTDMKSGMRNDMQGQMPEAGADDGAEHTEHHPE